jgi:hypothetical protein
VKRKPYNRELDDDLAELAAVAPDELVDKVRRLTAALKAGNRHVAIAVGKGPLVCLTCGMLWPCQPEG